MPTTFDECNYLEIDESLQNAGLIDDSAEHGFNDNDQHTLHCDIDTGRQIDDIIKVIEEQGHNVDDWSCQTGGRLEVVYDRAENIFANPCADCGFDMQNDDITCENCKTNAEDS